MRNRSTLVALVLTATGLVALAVAATREERPLAFTLGVAPASPVAAVAPGDEVCQSPIDVPPGGGFDRVAVSLGTYGRTGPPLSIRVLDQHGSRQLSSGRIRGGYPDIALRSRSVAAVHPVSGGQTIRVCVRNAGQRRVAVFGEVDAAARSSTALLDGAPTGGDLSLIFERARPKSTMSLAAVMIERASLFRPGWVGPWTYAIVAIAVAVAVPLLLAFALARASETSA